MWELISALVNALVLRNVADVLKFAVFLWLVIIAAHSHVTQGRLLADPSVDAVQWKVFL